MLFVMFLPKYITILISTVCNVDGRTSYRLYTLPTVGLFTSIASENRAREDELEHRQM